MGYCMLGAFHVVLGVRRSHDVQDSTSWLPIGAQTGIFFDCCVNHAVLDEWYVPGARYEVVAVVFVRPGTSYWLLLLYFFVLFCFSPRGVVGCFSGCILDCLPIEEKTIPRASAQYLL